MARLRRPSRRAVITTCAALAVCGSLALLHPRIEKQNDVGDRWSRAAAASIAYDATAHLNLLAATSPWAADITAASEKDLVALAEDVEATRPEGSATTDVSRCRAEAGRLWWPDAKTVTEKSCDQLDQALTEYARMDVLNYFTLAIEEVCDAATQDADPAYPMAQHYPFRTTRIAASLGAIDRRLASAPKDCTPEVVATPSTGR